MTGVAPVLASFLLIVGPPLLLLLLRSLVSRWVDPGERTTDTNRPTNKETR